ncbi:hypothetical protein M3148_16085 [Georgenia satyanarayanai]|uniref:hypothetical protein n=1 Tax=Georgenia satyanarayanai TaxID=860221 RepID=UPI002041621A|nr:hypothetical protein [Georgenia satyanarayanai]MCM3662497.1 hypothetical protein [Georgenia satyanarayanai]
MDTEREQRDRNIEDAAADYFAAADNYAEVTRKLEVIEGRMRTAVKSLLDLGESQARIAALLEIDTKEVRRLRAGFDGKTKTADQSKQADSQTPVPQDTDLPTEVHGESAARLLAGSGHGG